jgi:hypothetical protein
MTRRQLVQTSGAALAATFAVVGVVFLVIPGGVLAAFNWAGRGLGLSQSPTHAFTLYLALAVAYMYVVTVLAWQMARHPAVRAYPWVLVQAKAASALVCIVLFAAQAHYLIYLANFAVDGAIALFVWGLALRRAPRDELTATQAHEEHEHGPTPGAAEPLR